LVREVIGTQQVIDHFHRETGDRLRAESFSLGFEPGEGRVDRLGFEGPVVEKNAELAYEDAPAALRAKYGKFVIWVFEDPNEARTRRHLDAATGDLHWIHDVPERGPHAGSLRWSAHKLYGSNVLLSWFPEDGKRRVDHRWDQLDELLSGLGERGG
jgi:hypothetical protein